MVAQAKAEAISYRTFRFERSRWRVTVATSRCEAGTIMTELTQATVRKLLDYEPRTGILRWRRRQGEAAWNGRFAGRIAGTLARDRYWQINISYRLYAAHRLIWLHVYGRWPRDQIDHINHERSDNRLSNLRETTNRGNGQNRTLQVNNSSGVTGVVWSKRSQKWEARITINGRRTYIGKFERFKDACRARRQRERKHGFHPNHGS